MQRYANTNYFSDMGRGPQTNAYFSYLEPPDKWTDIIESISAGANTPVTPPAKTNDGAHVVFIPFGKGPGDAPS